MAEQDIKEAFRKRFPEAVLSIRTNDDSFYEAAALWHGFKAGYHMGVQSVPVSKGGQQ